MDYNFLNAIFFLNSPDRRNLEMCSVVSSLAFYISTAKNSFRNMARNLWSRNDSNPFPFKNSNHSKIFEWITLKKVFFLNSPDKGNLKMCAAGKFLALYISTTIFYPWNITRNRRFPKTSNPFPFKNSNHSNFLNGFVFLNFECFNFWPSRTEGTRKFSQSSFSCLFLY